MLLTQTTIELHIEYNASSLNLLYITSSMLCNCHMINILLFYSCDSFWMNKINSKSSIVRFVCNRAEKVALCSFRKTHTRTHKNNVLSYCINGCLRYVFTMHNHIHAHTFILNGFQQSRRHPTNSYIIWLLWKLFSNFTTKFIPRDPHTLCLIVFDLCFDIKYIL